MHERRSGWPVRVRAARTTAASALIVGVLGVVTSALVALPAPRARAQDGDPAEQREDVRRQQATAAAQLDTLRATDAEVGDALVVLRGNVAAQQARLDDARRALDAANAALAVAQRDEQEARATLDRLNERLRGFAIASYMRPPDNELSDAVISGEPLEAPERQALARFRIHDLTDVIDQVRAKRQDLERARSAADAARASAEQSQTAEAGRLTDVQAAATQQQGFVDDVEARIDRSLIESANLADKDAELSRQISAQQARLAAQLAGSGRGSGSGSSGSSRSSGGVSVTTVGGIEVNVRIADQLGAMLRAASADGIELSGSGYRDAGEQISLREQNCGSSDYAIYQMSSSECSPPTARPGSSMHEQGLAVDFSANGSLIRGRSSEGFQWLEANAERFGLYNLPSEPWHWSVNGS